MMPLQNIGMRLIKDGYTFLVSCGLIPILIPNHIPLANDILNNIELKGVLLTGGNDLMPLEETPSDRDNLENHILKWCMNERIPILGVCRGMQLILRHFNNPIVPVPKSCKSAAPHSYLR